MLFKVLKASFGVLSTDPNTTPNASSLAKIFQYLVVQEWQGENADYYQAFVTIDIHSQANQYLHSGEYSGDIGDLIVVTLSNICTSQLLYSVTSQTSM